MSEQGIPAVLDNIMITAGSQQGLDFLGKPVIDPGDTILTLAPTYFGALQAFSTYKPHYKAIRPQERNRTPDALRRSATAMRKDIGERIVAGDAR